MPLHALPAATDLKFCQNKYMNCNSKSPTPLHALGANFLLNSVKTN